MYNRAQVVDENFLRLVREAHLPPPITHFTPSQVGLTNEALLDLFESQVMSRHLDLLARILKNTG